MPKDEARDNASLYSTVIGNMARRAGQSAAGLHAEYRPIIHDGKRTEASSVQRWSNFTRWSNGLPIAQMGKKYQFKSGEGVVIAALHGTAGDFESFDLSLSNQGSSLGAGIYATNNAIDASVNYDGAGDDITGKINRIVEDIGGMDEDFARDEATRRLRIAHGGMILPLWIRMDNPFVIGKRDEESPGETWFDYQIAYDDEDDTAREQGAVLDFIEALKQAVRDMRDILDGNDDGSISSLIDFILEDACDNDGISANRIIMMAQNNEDMSYYYNKNGEHCSEEIIRRAIEIMGFDGMIDLDVDSRFGSKAKDGAPMAGVTSETTHFIAFDPRQVKSRMGNNGDFDLDTVSILKQSATSRAENDGMTRRAPATQAFRDWSGRYNKARGIWYHKTTADFDKFDPERREMGFHIGTLAQVDAFARLGDNPDGTNIMPVRISVENPIRLEDCGSFHADGIARQLARKKIIPMKLAKEIQDEIEADYKRRKHWDPILRAKMQDAGYDGIVYRNTFERGNKAAHDSWIVFEPTQIKSAIGNNGDYSREDPSILRQPGVMNSTSDTTADRGYIVIGPRGNQRRFQIALLERADKSTFLHEASHLYLEMMAELATAPHPSERIRRDFHTVLSWMGLKSRDELKTEHHEMFARASEAYMMQAQAPTTTLTPIFKRFGNWLKSIYKKTEALDVTLSDDIRGVFDRLYGADSARMTSNNRDIGGRPAASIKPVN